MSYKYTNVREYQGGLIFEDTKNQKNVNINSGGVEIYGKEYGITSHTTFNTSGFTNNNKVYESFFDMKRGVKLYGADSTKNVTFSASEITYTKDYDAPDLPYFKLSFSESTAAQFYEKTGGYTALSNFSPRGCAFAYSAGLTQRIISVDGRTGVICRDEKNNIQNQVTVDGLFLEDAAGNTCYLKFEDGKLKINGKEIATIENS